MSLWINDEQFELRTFEWALSYTSHFFASNTGETAPVISAEGFQFLLLDTKSQVWCFLINYITALTNRSANPLDLVQVGNHDIFFWDNMNACRAIKLMVCMVTCPEGNARGVACGVC